VSDKTTGIPAQITPRSPEGFSKTARPHVRGLDTNLDDRSSRLNKAASHYRDYRSHLGSVSNPRYPCFSARGNNHNTLQTAGRHRLTAHTSARPFGATGIQSPLALHDLSAGSPSLYVPALECCRCLGASPQPYLGYTCTHFAIDPNHPDRHFSHIPGACREEEIDDV
jgi:hypothetical protein